MMFELLCGKFNEEYFREKCDEKGSVMYRAIPEWMLSDSFTIHDRVGWFGIADKAEQCFGAIAWTDCCSYVCHGDYESMKQFMIWAKAKEEDMEKLDALPKAGEYGLVFIEH